MKTKKKRKPKGGLGSGKKSVSDSTLKRYWKLAVLSHYGNTCQICGKTHEGIDIHHIVHVGKRVLRWDWFNGVPVCRDGCHNFADTLSGRDEIRFKIGEDKYAYLKKNEHLLYKDYLFASLMNDNEFREFELKKLKQILNKE